MPFLRLTRDRRGFENTFLMHADRPGDRPRLLYWYRTAPGIMQGRAALDEDAIRTIEEQHPDIDFDWPAIIALSEVMTPEDEAPPPRAQQPQRRDRKPRDRDRDRSSRAEPAAPAFPTGIEPVPSAAAPQEPATMQRDDEVSAAPSDDAIEPEAAPRGLVDELAGREIAGRLRARYAEVVARIDSRELDGAARDAWLARAEAIDPDAWESPEAVLQGVSRADALFEKLKTELSDAARD